MKRYLGITPSLYPYIEEPKIMKKMKEHDVGILFSYWQFYKDLNRITSLGLHDYFKWDGDFMIDSGAYSAFNSGVKIDLHDYFVFLYELEPDKNVIIVNLDVVGNKKESYSNWEYLNATLDTEILPVIHYPSKFDLESIGNPYFGEKYIGLGGMVNALKILAKNQKQFGSPTQVAKWLVHLSKKKKYHGFGVGSPLHQLAFEDVIYSLDWLGWRRNAATCGVYTPEGTRVIPEARIREEKKYAPLSKEEFEKYHPPFIESYELLHEKGTLGWNYRALWSIWTFLCVEEYRKVMSQNKYVINLKKIINKRKTANLNALLE